MVAIASRYVIVRDLRLHYLEAGEGPPVLLLHGWPTSVQLWRHCLEPIAASGRRVIALDLPGFGRSDKPLACSYSFPFFERVLDGFLDEAGIERLGMAVHDLGGPVGLFWASKQTDRLIDLALLNTIVFPEPSWAVSLFVATTRIRGLSDFISSPTGIGLMLRLGIVDQTRVTRETLRLYREPYATREARQALLKAGHGLHPRGFDRIVAGLAGLTCPIRVVYGSRDRILPDIALTVVRLSALMPRIEVTELTNCGHFLQEDRPAEVADLLSEFFGRQS